MWRTLADIRLEIARAHERQGTVGDAIEQLRQAVELPPDAVEPRVALARLLLELGAPAEAERALERLAGGDEPPAPVLALLASALALLASALAWQGKLAEARAALERAARIDAGSTAVRLARADLARAEGRAAAARDALEGAVAADPTSVDARVALARTYVEHRRLGDAERTSRETSSASRVRYR